MEQIIAPEEMKVKINFQKPGIPYTANLLQPVVFKDGENYCCALGANLQEGIFGLGETPEQAIQDWDNNLTKRIEISVVDDHIIAAVKDVLKKDAEENQTSDQDISRSNPQVSPPLAPGGQQGSEGSVVVDRPASRRNTTDQSNVDGSEYR